MKYELFFRKFAFAFSIQRKLTLAEWDWSKNVESSENAVFLQEKRGFKGPPKEMNKFIFLQITERLLINKFSLKGLKGQNFFIEFFLNLSRLKLNFSYHLRIRDSNSYQETWIKVSLKGNKRIGFFYGLINRVTWIILIKKGNIFKRFSKADIA